MPEDVIGTPDGGEAAAEAAAHASASADARKIAALIAERAAKPESGITIEKMGGEATPEPTPEEIAAKAAADAAAAAAVTGGEETAEAPEDIGEVEKILQEVGIDLGITASDVPEELHPAYARLVQSAADFAQSVLQQQLSASEALQQVDEFSKQLEGSPDRLLLSLAVSKPEAFAKAVEVYQQMQTDERMKDLVVRELQSEARLREAERREKLVLEGDKRTKARQVIAATHRAARSMGVNFDLAEKVVALAVQANGGDLDVAEVEGIVSELKPAGPKIKKPLVATPNKVEVTATANTQPVAGSGNVPPVKQAVTDGKPKEGGTFRRLIADAAAKLRQGAQ